jgi:hypothetical protein
MSQYHVLEALRDTLPTLFACLPGAGALVLLAGLFARRRHADSHVALCRDGRGIFSSRLARTRATKHEAAHEETEAVAEDRRCCMAKRHRFGIWPLVLGSLVWRHFGGLLSISSKSLK